MSLESIKVSDEIFNKLKKSLKGKIKYLKRFYRIRDSIGKVRLSDTIPQMNKVEKFPSHLYPLKHHTDIGMHRTAHNGVPKVTERYTKGKRD